MNLDFYLYHTHTKNSKWLTDLAVRAKTITLLEKNLREKLCDLWLSKKSS